MNKYIPYNITCPLAFCSRSNTCARYANYQKAKAEEASFMVLKSRFTSLNADFWFAENAKTYLQADNLSKGDNSQRRLIGSITGKELAKWAVLNSLRPHRLNH